MSLKYYLYRIRRIYANEGSSGVLQSIYRFIHHQSLLKTGIVKKKKTDANIEKILWVDPREITEQPDARMGDRLKKPGVVYGGRWDLQTRPLNERYTIRSMRRHFLEGIEWAETEYFDRKLNLIQEGGDWRGCESKEDLIEFFGRYDELHASIRDRGYKPQRELLRMDPEKTKEENNDAPKPELNEIGVSITRSGDFLWQHRGEHRLCIAQILGITEVPVQVLARHKKWQTIRDHIKEAGSKNNFSDKATQYMGHPDLEDLNYNE